MFPLFYLRSLTMPIDTQPTHEKTYYNEQQLTNQSEKNQFHGLFKILILRLLSANNPMLIYRISFLMHVHVAELYEIFPHPYQCLDPIVHWLISSNSTLLCIRFVPFPSSNWQQVNGFSKLFVGFNLQSILPGSFDTCLRQHDCEMFLIHDEFSLMLVESSTFVVLIG